MTVGAVVKRDTAHNLAELKLRRAEVAADASLGDEAALKTLDEIETLIVWQERVLEREELASAVLERREREAALVAADGERARLEAEALTLEAERDEVIGRAVWSAQTTAGLALEAVELDRRIEANRHLLGMNHRAIEASMIIDRISVEFRDAGLGGGFEPLRGAWRASLLERWPTPADPKATVALCSICSHEKRAEIEEALAAGDMTLRAIEELHGVSRSALSRHRAHSAAVAS